MTDNKVKIKVIQPWSNMIYQMTMPEIITQGLIEHTDKLREDPNTPSYGESLVGQVEEELEIDVSSLDVKIANFLLYGSREWLYNQLNQGFSWEPSWKLTREEIFPQFISMWTVSQKDGEYNPIHTHPIAAVSGVLYIKIPEYKKDKKDTTKEVSYYIKENTTKLRASKHQRTNDGSLVFTNNSGADRRYCVSNFSVNPKVGELYIFGGMQPHQVYPFRSVDGQGERRSISFNIAYTTKELIDDAKKRNEYLISGDPNE